MQNQIQLHGHENAQDLERRKSEMKQAQRNRRKRLSSEEKTLLLMKAVKRGLVGSHKRHFLFILKFLSRVNLKNAKQLRLFYQQIALKNMHKNKLLDCIILRDNSVRQAFGKWRIELLNSEQWQQRKKQELIRKVKLGNRLGHKLVEIKVSL